MCTGLSATSFPAVRQQAKPLSREKNDMVCFAMLTGREGKGVPKGGVGGGGTP